ncbi:hypothetical protein [uncultured Methanospirillum sp.]|uniref:hypothetical protein n=1 Tax=uncultured Methanospirillum sp. TaxID=262503 RepID=UPI0029C7C444|nr:hypothetical protein [uncultured Methanospirillum sp.]
MAFINKIFMGGSNPQPTKGHFFCSSICFELVQKNSLSITREINDGQYIWEIEILERCQYIVARCKNPLPIDKIRIRGNDVCQEFLDYLSVEYSINYEVKPSSNFNIILYKNNSKFQLNLISEVNFEFQTSLTIRCFDENGNEIQNNTPKLEKIEEFIRYYRKSNLSKDVYTAYKELYLSFELMLQKINPKKDEQSEINWLKESLRIIKSRISLSDSINNIITEQYYNIRLKLFHSKDDKILPGSISERAIKEAYPKLMDLWINIATNYLKIHIGGGGLMNAAFLDYMDSTFGQSFLIKTSNDNTPPSSSDTTITPKNMKLINFKKNHYQHDPKSTNKILISGSLTKLDYCDIDNIFRIGYFNQEDILFFQIYIDGGLYLDGIDIFQVEIYLGYINANAPRLNF